MYCPLCHSEYQPGIRICADCHVTLVEKLPQERPLEEVRWAAVDKLPGKAYAEMIAEILDQEGIAHFIKSDVLTSTFSIGGLGSAGGTVTLYVPEDQVAAAREIVATVID